MRALTFRWAFQPTNSDMLFGSGRIFQRCRRIGDTRSFGWSRCCSQSFDHSRSAEFGATYVGCNMPNEITLSNIGQEDLVIYNIGGLEEPFLSEALPTFPLTLLPEESYTLALDFVPGLEGQFTDVFEVASNDPDGAQSVDFSGVGQYVASYQQQWANPVDPPSDILFVVDRSCSMDPYTSQLASNFQTFINELSNYVADWQVMAVTDDNGCSNYLI